MTTLRKASVHCPKCGHGFTVRDNGGVPKAKADAIWRAADRAMTAVDQAFERLDKALDDLAKVAGWR